MSTEGFIWDVVFPIFCVLHKWCPPWTPKGLPRGQFQWGKSNPSSLGWRNTTKLLLPRIPRTFLCSTTVRWQRNKKKKAQTERDESMKPFHTDECQSISMESWLGQAFPKVFQLQEHVEELQDSTDACKGCAVRSYLWVLAEGLHFRSFS